MAFSFPFFHSSTPDEGAQNAPFTGSDLLTELAVHSQSPGTIASETSGGAAASPTGLAALAVQQSTGGAPPARKLASSGTALAAGLALASPLHGEMQAPPTAPLAPPSSHLNAASYPAGREMMELRVELERQMDQLRQDVFGAAMGVSALKDRLETLESSVGQSHLALAESQARVAAVVQEWSEELLPTLAAQAVEVTLERALQQTVSAFNSYEFFRMPVQSPHLTAEMFFTQPPHILSASRS